MSTLVSSSPSWQMTTDFFISLHYTEFASTIFWKTTPYHEVPTSKLHCWYGVFGVMYCAIFPSEMVCSIASKQLNFGLIWPCHILPVLHFSNFKWSLTWFLFSNDVLRGEHRIQAMTIECITYSFVVFFLFVNVNCFYSSVSNLARHTRSWLVYDQMMFSPFSDHGSNSTHRYIQKFRNPVTNSLIMFCNNNQSLFIWHLLYSKM